MSGFLVLLVLFALMWLVLIRPQQQRMRRQRALVATIDVGDDVVTVGGLVGRIVSADSERVVLEVGPDAVHLTLLRAAINRKLMEAELAPPGVVSDADIVPDGGATAQDTTDEGPTDEGVS